MMRVLKLSIVPYLLILALSAAFLFVIKYKVQNLSKEVRSVNAQILSEKENIHILKAEYTYLANPKRIQKLANEHLKLQTIKPDQVVKSFSNLTPTQQVAESHE